MSDRREAKASSNVSSTTISSVDIQSSLLQANADRIYQAWLICEVVTIIMTVILGYTIVCLCIFQFRHGKQKERSRSDRNICGRKHSNERVLYALTMCAAVFAFLRCFADIDLIFGRYSELSCRYWKKPKIFIAFVSLLFGILSYWMRQRIIYANKQLKHIVNKFTRFVSIWIIGGLGILYLAGLLYFMIQDIGYRPLPPYGCSESNAVAPFAIVGSTIFLSQITLALLLVYPIFKKNELSSSIRARSSVKTRHGSTSQATRHKKLIQIVRKTFATALVAVMSNAIGLVLEVVIVTHVDNIGMAIVDVNLTVLVLCAVVSSVDAKRRLFPFYRHHTTKPEFTTSIPQTSTSHSKSFHASPGLTRSADNLHKDGRVSHDKSDKVSE